MVLAQLISDFILQSDKMAKGKRWFSWHMIFHIIIVFSTTILLTGLWQLAAAIAVLHWLVDSIKIELHKRRIGSDLILFTGDQISHMLLTTIFWALYYQVTEELFNGIALVLSNYKMALIILGYVVVIWPIGYLIKYSTQAMVKVLPNESATDHTKKGVDLENDDDKVEHGGRRIGQFERVIILTFVLLQQYEAIGFLITGKSIIRFAQRNENLRSEYVLIGTMMSYGFSILAGAGINWLLATATFGK